MRLAFMGSPEFSVPALVELIAAGHDIAAVYTQPPRPAGRGQKEQKQPVHECAEAHELEVRTPENFKSAEAKEAFADLDLDIAIVIAYGLILPKAILDAPEHGCLNLHASLLPRWRGAAPIQRAIMAGDNITGIQLMQMEKGLDTGPVLLSETVPISATDTAGTLHDRLSRIGADMLPRALAALERGGLTATPQSNEGVLYAEKISSAEARIDWSRPAEEVDWHIRGLSPFPGAWFEATDARGKPVRCKALFSAVDPDKQGKPGEILSVTDGICVGCGKGAVRLHQIQRAGKRAQNPEDFLRGFPLSLGDIFL